MKKLFLIAATFVLGLIVNINAGPDGIKFTTQQDKAEASSCHMVMRYCGSDMDWKCLDTPSTTSCDSRVCYTDPSCGS